MKTDRKATIRLPQAVALYIGAVLGSGILIVPGLAAQMAGPASLLDWGAMMLLVLPLSVCMAHLAQKYPNSGGVSYFVTKAFGARSGYFVGWFFLMSVPIGAPVAALTGAGYLTASLGLSERFRIAIACSVLLAALFLNFIGMSLAGKVQVAVVAGILAVIFLAIIGAVPNIKAVNFAPFMPHGPGKVAEASTLLFWCFIGWEAVSHLTEEFVHPEKDVMRATVISAVIIGVIYFSSCCLHRRNKQLWPDIGGAFGCHRFGKLWPARCRNDWHSESCDLFGDCDRLYRGGSTACPVARRERACP
ncbi:amino acid permease [Terrilactibacillus sp. S3-3]|nr:amino acid permease [Terrilactibacillus sp. S3-3]